MVNREVVEEWLRKADDDFEFASINLREGKPFYAQICFHFHQAVEKYLKSFIIARELEFRRIHDLPLLLKICAFEDHSLFGIQEECEYLNTFYIDTRYPVHWPTDFSLQEADKAHQAALNIRSKIHEVLKYIPTR